MGPTASYGFKDIMKKTVTTQFKTLGRKNWKDKKEIKFGKHLKVLFLDKYKSYYVW